MARFYMSADNSRHGRVTAANPSHVHIRGWNTGIRVDTVKLAEGDRFDVYATGGSGGGGGDVKLGELVFLNGDTAPRWKPEGEEWPAS